MSMDVPMHLSHKPIIACDYPYLTDEDNDVRYISLGRSQYNDNQDLSLKVWRRTYSTGRWSPQGEELPVTRALYVMEAFLRMLQRIQTGVETPAKEEIVNEADLDFAKRILKEHRKTIVKALHETKHALSKIDIDAF